MYYLIIFLTGFFSGIYVGQTYDVPLIEPIFRRIYISAINTYQNHETKQKIIVEEEEKQTTLPSQ